MMDWDMWCAIGACGSAIASFGALCYARKALNTWNRQEQFKVKLEFKRALLELEDAFETMPDNWSSVQYRIAKTIAAQRRNGISIRVDEAEEQLFYKKENLNLAYGHSVKAWVLCEELFKDNTIHDEWKSFRISYAKYILEGGNKNDYLSMIKNIYSKIPVFNG
ncbi:hypothetical protein [Citrobacter freundii]|uniref:hypothetical protein n=1 Tax=Citrobacter freundii TaxID=546 RepID=UPI0015F7C749|nr:hypothetical protein [Citrobacter freundii]MBA8048953.1 hypothetical protein [Citrobacter freundii]